HSWTFIESSRLPSGTPRSAIYINNSKRSMQAFQIIDIPLSDITAVAINTVNSQKPSLIINIYNPKDYDLITPLADYLQSNLNSDNATYHGDPLKREFIILHSLKHRIHCFNLHFHWG